MYLSLYFSFKIVVESFGFVYGRIHKHTYGRNAWCHWFYYGIIWLLLGDRHLVAFLCLGNRLQDCCFSYFEFYCYSLLTMAVYIFPFDWKRMTSIQCKSIVCQIYQCNRFIESISNAIPWNKKKILFVHFKDWDTYPVHCKSRRTDVKVNRAELLFLTINIENETV